MLSFWKIVFGLKRNQKLYDCKNIMKQISTLHVIISEHDATVDECERPGLHYHGIIEYETDKDVANNDAILLLNNQCSFLKIEFCEFPELSVLDLAQPGKKLTIIEIAESAHLINYYAKVPAVAEIGFGTCNIEKVSDFDKIVNYVTANPAFKLDEIHKFIQKECIFLTLDEIDQYATDAIALVHQKVLNESILCLCKRFSTDIESYYSVVESADLVMEWCNYQSIDAEAFTNTVVNCLDKQVEYKNSLLFQGPFESGALTIIRSISDACSFVGEILNETTGFTYLWEQSLEKRCIIMRDCVVDERMIEKLMSVARGVGTFVPHQEGLLKFLRPTPVIFMCADDSDLQPIQDSFLGSYTNLKPFAKLSNDHRRLHPGWIYVLYYYSMGNACLEANDNEVSFNDSSRGRMDESNINQLRMDQNTSYLCDAENSISRLATYLKRTGDGSL